MDVTIRVTWSDGSASIHCLTLFELDDDEVDADAEAGLLEQKLADYLDDGWPTDGKGLPLGWTDVVVVGDMSE